MWLKDGTMELPAKNQDEQKLWQPIHVFGVNQNNPPKSIKKILNKDLSNEAVQAFMKVFNSSHKIINIFWTLSVFVLIGLCSYLIIQSILTYLSYGVSTTMINIVENPADFPKITICK